MAGHQGLILLVFCSFLLIVLAEPQVAGPSSTISPSCTTGWSRIFNLSLPKSGREYESYYDVKERTNYMTVSCNGGIVTDVQCLVFDNGQWINYNDTEIRVKCIYRGINCVGRCRDYAIRLYCKCATFTTTIPSTMSTTEIATPSPSATFTSTPSTMSTPEVATPSPSVTGPSTTISPSCTTGRTRVYNLSNPDPRTEDRQKCPEGFEWKDCWCACEQTCNSIHKKELCSKECSSGCFCPSGLVEKDGKCIKASLCKDCKCKDHGPIDYITFDGNKFQFQKPCTYILVRYQQNDFDHDFEVYGTNSKCSQVKERLCTNVITILYRGNTVIIDKDFKVAFNQEIIENHPIFYDGIEIVQISSHLLLAAIEKVHLKIYMYKDTVYFSIRLPSVIYYNKTVGLCGICKPDGNVDHYHVNGYFTENVTEFVSSWLVNGSEKEDDCPPRKPPREPPREPPPSNVNVTLQNCTWPKNICSDEVPPDEYIETCEHNLRLTGNLTFSECESMLQYSRTCCEVAKIILNDWLNDRGCDRISCDNDMVYECRNTCDAKCKEECDDSFKHDCYCKGNLVLKKDECIDRKYCVNCKHEGREYKIGETWISRTNSCISMKCEENNGKAEVVTTVRQSAPIPENCKNITKDEVQCCEFCEEMPQPEKCEATRIAPEKTLRYFTFNDTHRGNCRNRELIHNLTECTGLCSSESGYSMNLKGYDRKCKCCIPVDSVNKTITLVCPDNSVIEKEYEQPSKCKCAPCSGGE